MTLPTVASPTSRGPVSLGLAATDLGKAPRFAVGRRLLVYAVFIATNMLFYAQLARMQVLNLGPLPGSQTPISSMTAVPEKPFASGQKPGILSTQIVRRSSAFCYSRLLKNYRGDACRILQESESIAEAGGEF
ncbi:hypothetical protein NHQ30_006766 [Ciborinia camelliae]|nr:hypothetical protein NHQ30_006766 [Ciborinia camelliae]